MNKYLSHAHKILDLTSTLIEGPNQVDTKYKRILEGIARRNYYTLFSIVYLAESEFHSDSILDLSRRLIEDMVAVEFMKLKGKDEQAAKFIDFIKVEIKNDYEFLILNGLPPPPNMVAEVTADFEKVKKQFEYKPGEIAHSWAMCSVESMIEELLKADAIKATDKNMFLMAYVLGNRKNHLSPLDVMSFWNQEIRDRNQQQNMNIGMVFSITSYFHVINEFAIVQNREDLLHQLEEFWGSFNSSSS